MGSCFSTRKKEITTKLDKNCRLLLLGLDNAGKTTIIYTLKHGTAVDTIATVGFNVENILGIKDTFLTVVDVGGQEKIRSLWAHYYEGTNGVIFVVDSFDVSRLQEAKNELHQLMGHAHMKDAFLLVLANKSDLPNAKTETELFEELNLSSIIETGKYVKIQQCCAIRGDGLIEGFSWIEDIHLEIVQKKQIREREERKKKKAKSPPS